MGVIVHDFQAEICAQGHCKTSLQKVPVSLAKTVLADEKYNNCHDGGYRKLRYVLVVAAFYEALLDSAAVVKDKPVSHEERDHENPDNN